MNNIIKNVEITKTNLKVAANSDFRWAWDLPTIPGYYPLEVLAWNFRGDYDLRLQDILQVINLGLKDITLEMEPQRLHCSFIFCMLKMDFVHM